MPINKDLCIPPPMIGKIGPYTVFVTPPSTPTPTEPHHIFESPKKVAAPAPAPVQPPPLQFDKSFVASNSDGSLLGYFKNAAWKVQNAHSSLDDHLARWFGLNQSKYQWALDDYYESKGLEKEGVKVKEISSKIQNVWIVEGNFVDIWGSDRIRLYVPLYLLLQQLTGACFVY